MSPEGSVGPHELSTLSSCIPHTIVWVLMKIQPIHCVYLGICGLLLAGCCGFEAHLPGPFNVAVFWVWYGFLVAFV